MLWKNKMEIHLNMKADDWGGDSADVVKEQKVLKSGKPIAIISGNRSGSFCSSLQSVIFAIPK